MRRRVSDRHLILYTLLALGLELLLLLSRMNVIPHFLGNSDSQKIKAGFVVKTEKDLKKKMADGLIWDQIDKDEPLYFYDSLLTLAESSASLHLYEKTEIHLSENTLVTIEPDSQDSENQIRLKFLKGDFRARNPFAKTKIDTEGTTLVLEKGSEVNLRSQGEHGVEVEVLAGELRLSGGETVQKNQLIQIEKSKITAQKQISQKLEFSKKPVARIYTHQNQENIHFEWPSTQASTQLELWQNKNGRKEILTQGDITLDLGKYFYRLKSGAQISETHSLEIWKAPPIHLISPLPRDRSSFNSQFNFIWTAVPQAHKYKFEFVADNSPAMHKESVDNFVQWNLDHEQNIQWQVYGIDQDGYLIPPLYSYPLFVRENPLAAPVIKRPLLRKPANKRTEKPQSRLEIFWHLLFEPATAADESPEKNQWEAVFSWEKTPGAQHYIIEISDTPDFRTPLVEKKISQTEFIWTIKKIKKYYWRVAAGTEKRLGVFSEPTSIDFSNIQSDSVEIDGVQVRSKAPTPAPPADTPLPVLINKEPVAEAPPMATLPAREIKNLSTYSWSPSALLWSLQSESEVRAKWQGYTPALFSFAIEKKKSESQSVLYQGSFSSYKIVADNVSDLPFQSDLTGNEYLFSVSKGTNSSYWYYGAILGSELFAKRLAEEQLELNSVFVIGFQMDYRIDSRRHNWNIFFGNATYALTTSHTWNWNITAHFRMGPQLKAGYYLHQQKSNTKLNFGINSELEF